MESKGDKLPSELNKEEIKDFICAGSILPCEADRDVKEDTETFSSENGDGVLNENNCFLENDQNQLVLYDPLTNGMGDGVLGENNCFAENGKNQLVVYDPLMNGMDEVALFPEPLNSQPPTFSRKDPSKMMPTIAAYTVQCANCLKWRLIPTKEKYEEIRENIKENPFYCESASEWRSSVSCDDPEDIQQDNNRLWAIDKASIARPPPGWQRILRIRSEGSSKFADVHYEAPSGRRFRSLIEIQKYLAEISELAAEIRLSQFSFVIPKPLQEDYVKKRMKSSRPQEPDEVWMSFPGRPDDLHNDEPELSPSSFESPPHSPSNQSAKKRTKKSSTKDIAPLP